LHLSSEQEAFLQLSDEEVERLLAAAKTGDVNAREELLCWAYETALHYFSRTIEDRRPIQDAEDFASEFVLDLEKKLSVLRSATRYARSVLRIWKTTRIRSLLEKLQKSSRAAAPISAVEESVDSEKQFSEEQILQLAVIFRTLKKADPITKEIVEKFYFENRTSEEISIEMNRKKRPIKMKETAVNMRRSRFYFQVRQNYDKLKKKRG
jgi:hypothetical protein